MKPETTWWQNAHDNTSSAWIRGHSVAVIRSADNAEELRSFQADLDFHFRLTGSHLARTARLTDVSIKLTTTQQQPRLADYHGGLLLIEIKAPRTNVHLDAAIDECVLRGDDGTEVVLNSGTAEFHFGTLMLSFWILDEGILHRFIAEHS
jgi:hypothetical protein